MPRTTATSDNADHPHGAPQPRVARDDRNRRNRVTPGPNVLLLGETASTDGEQSSKPQTSICTRHTRCVRSEHMFDVDLQLQGVEGDGPGAQLALLLSSVDMDRLTGHELIVMLRAVRRMVSHYEALAFGVMAALRDRMAAEEDLAEFPELAASAEIRAALRLTRRAADRDLSMALELQDRLPQVGEALAAGEVDLPRAWVMLRGTEHLRLEEARAVVDLVIADAARLTTGQLHSRIRRLCLEADPDGAESVYQRAVEGRRLVAEATPEGTGNLLGLDLPAELVGLVSKRINYLARSLRTRGEARTMDQLRADVFLDLLAGEAHGASGGGVGIEVDLETLMGLAARPGELAGFGPVIADIARQVAQRQQHAEWRWTVTGEGGQPLYQGVTRRRPNAAQRRAVQMRDRNCVFPGCRMPAADCDLDHRVPWADSGRTAVDDLAPGCRHDHIVRHNCGWTYQRLPNGDYLWTSRLGHRYTTSGLPP